MLTKPNPIEDKDFVLGAGEETIKLPAPGGAGAVSQLLIIFEEVESESLTDQIKNPAARLDSLFAE